jgi:hypothetical protein
LAHHVHRMARMGPPVLISEPWYKYVIPVKAKDKICEQLSRVGIRRSNLFPGLRNLAA